MNAKIDGGTIAAQITPAGTGAVSMIRISGEKSFLIADQLTNKNNFFREIKTHTIHYLKIYGENGETIDDVLFFIYKKPNSYTGEDSIEISFHGSPLISKIILRRIFQLGARLANPGEFTQRAFLNGRLDLTQAEAVIDIINSRTEASLRGARNQIDGILSKRINFLKEKLINIISLLELELDFAEEDIVFADKQEILSLFEEIINELSGLESSYKFGKAVKEGVNVAIVGRPNVGKSSLLNYFAKESRAIVSDIPGTTRDIISEDISIDGILFKFFDTAGIRESCDEIEKEGVERSVKAIKNSDLVIYMFDNIENFDERLFGDIANLSGVERVLLVYNKIDLYSDKSVKADAFISAKCGTGIEKLIKALKKKAIDSNSYTESSVIITSERHYLAISNALSYLKKGKESLQRNMSSEFISVDIRSSINCLAEIIGEVSTDEILNNIFSKFCIGK